MRKTGGTQSLPTSIVPNDGGRVEYSTEVQILRPVDPSRGNHSLFYEVLNRGNKLSVRDFNDAASGNDVSTKDTAGNGFLLNMAMPTSGQAARAGRT
jgi:hypothetical protein